MMRSRSLICVCLLLSFLSTDKLVFSADLSPFVEEIGATFCMFLAYKSQLPRKYFNLCPQPKCDFNTWSEALKATNATKEKERVVVSYAHNGFGNQLWEHSIAFMIAKSLKARLLIAVIPDNLAPGGVSPPNTWQGMGVMERLLPKEYLYEELPVDSPIRSMCDSEDFVIADRPVDWRNKNYSSHFSSNMKNILSDKNPRCLKFLGYFQNLPLCAEDVRKLWTPNLFGNFTMRPGENDISIYLRCMPRHYYFNNKHFYDAILTHTKFDRVWLFQAPECPNKLDDNPSRDGLVASVLRLLYTKYNATRWPGYSGPADDNAPLMHDLAGLAYSRKMILPVSSWAHWAGVLAPNATEIHVNAPPHHAIMYDNPHYIYHSEKHKVYFGRWNATAYDMEYRIDFTKLEQQQKEKMERLAKMGTPIVAVVPPASTATIATATIATATIATIPASDVAGVAPSSNVQFEFTLNSINSSLASPTALSGSGGDGNISLIDLYRLY